MAIRNELSSVWSSELYAQRSFLAPGLPHWFLRRYAKTPLISAS